MYKIGLGIDTGGTCTDGVIYHLTEKKVLASAKSLTTRQNLMEVYLGTNVSVFV